MKIRLNELKKRFGDKTAVDIAGFTINDGDMLGLVGNNGAGKTTLFRLMLDLLRADEGNVVFVPERDAIAREADRAAADGGAKGRVGLMALPDEIDPSASEDWKLLTGAYIDNSFLIDFLTAEEYFEFVGRVSGLSKDETTERLGLFDNFMSGEILGQKKYIRDMSAGNKQKIGIVAAMLNRPQLLILDEPFNFLDPSSQHHLKHLLTNFNHETGATVLVSSHNLQHTVEISTRVALLEHGIIIDDIDNSDGKANAELEKYFNV